MNISVEYGKEPFTSFHLGVLKLRLSKDFPDRPDVIEFYADQECFSSIRFHVFTYDSFDTLNFFSQVCKANKKWKEDIVGRKIEPSRVQITNLKPPGFFNGTQVWTVQENRIMINKTGKDDQNSVLLESICVTPSASPSHPMSFRYSPNPSTDPILIKCPSINEMKQLLDAIYNNAFIQKVKSM